MTLFATLPADERAAYIDEAAARLGLPAVLVEKDFWVCWTLGRIFALPEIGEHVVFKGGTSLSKVFKAIRRFSEDIDLQISCRLLGVDETRFWEEGISGSEGQRRVRELETASAAYVRSDFMPALERQVTSVLGTAGQDEAWLVYEHDDGSNSNVIWFTYPSIVAGDSGYVRKAVKLEPGTLVDQRPVGSHAIQPMIAEFTDDEFEDFRTDVVALEFERTFWEKATILHAEHHRTTGANIGGRRSRHYSDFAALWRHERREGAVRDLDLLAAVVRNKKVFFKSSWANYDTAKPPTLRLVPPDGRVQDLAADYGRMRDFFFDEPPAFEDLLMTLREAERDINGA